MLQIRFLFLKKKKKIINIFTNFYRSLSLEKEITAQIKLQIHKYLSLQSPQNPITSHQSLAKSPPEWKKKRKKRKKSKLLVSSNKILPKPYRKQKTNFIIEYPRRERDRCLKSIPLSVPLLDRTLEN